MERRFFATQSTGFMRNFKFTTVVRRQSTHLSSYKSGLNALENLLTARTQLAFAALRQLLRPRQRHATEQASRGAAAYVTSGRHTRHNSAIVSSLHGTGASKLSKVLKKSLVTTDKYFTVNSSVVNHRLLFHFSSLCLFRVIKLHLVANYMYAFRKIRDTQLAATANSLRTRSQLSVMIKILKKLLRGNARMFFSQLARLKYSHPHQAPAEQVPPGYRIARSLSRVLVRTLAVPFVTLRVKKQLPASRLHLLRCKKGAVILGSVLKLVTFPVMSAAFLSLKRPRRNSELFGALFMLVSVFKRLERKQLREPFELLDQEDTKYVNISVLHSPTNSAYESPVRVYSTPAKSPPSASYCFYILSRMALVLERPALTTFKFAFARLRHHTKEATHVRGCSEMTIRYSRQDARYHRKVPSYGSELTQLASPLACMRSPVSIHQYIDDVYSLSKMQSRWAKGSH